MALQSVLEIVNRACDEMGLTRPGSSGVVGASTPQERQLLALFNAAGEQLVAEHDWSALMATASILTATASAAYVLPTDFDRVVEDTGWDRTNLFPLVGSISPQRHQYWLSSVAVAPITRKEYRLFVGNGGGTFYIHPEPQAAETITFMYISKNWATDLSGANPDNVIAADTDLTKFNPKLMVKELKWRFRAAKGLDANALRGECDDLRNLMISRDQGTGVINMEGMNQIGLIDSLIPDGNWDLT